MLKFVRILLTIVISMTLFISCTEEQDNSNNIDEMLLYMFIKQKHFGKSNTQNCFRRKNENIKIKEL